MTYRRLQVYFFLIVFVLAIILSFLVFRPFIGLMVFSGVLAVLMRPVYRRLTRYFRGHQKLAALLSVLLALVLIMLPIMFFIGALVTEAIDLFNRVRGQVNFGDIEGTLSKILSPEQAHLLAQAVDDGVRNIVSYVQPVLSGVTANIVAIFSNTFAVILGFVLVLMGMYYLLKDGQALKKELLDLSPLTDEDDSTIFDRITSAIEAVAFGQFAVSLIKGLIGGVLFLILGLPAPVFWGSMIALTNFIPAVGTALVTVPFTVYLFVTGQFWRGLTLALASFLIIGLIDNFLTPQLMKGRIKIHPMLILLSMLGGLSFFGPLGLFFGPIVLSVTMALVDIYKKEFRASIERIEKI